MKKLVLLPLFFILLAGMVLANYACCQQTLGGNSCLYTDESNCDTTYQFAYATCEQTSYCQVGCCYSSDTGDCFKNTPKSTCENTEGASWQSSSTCEIDQCTQGCCVLGDQAFYTTEVKCKNVATQYEDIEMVFDTSYDTEISCINSVKNLDEGCCIKDGEYIFTTREGCGLDNAEVGVGNFSESGFYEGILCSNDLFASGCAKQQNSGCYDGDVYWYDSCGNRENIYSVDFDLSYNEGYVLSEQRSCDISKPEDPTCGNCDYAQGTLCGLDINGVMDVGDYTCRDLTCGSIYEDDVSPNADGEQKDNGESWCVYDMLPGRGQDYVGSRQYRHMCLNGEEIVEPCSDFREQICIQGELGGDVLYTIEALREAFQQDEDYVQAGCRSNRWSDCYNCNTEETDESKIECCVNTDLRDCYWMQAGVAYPVNETYLEAYDQDILDELNIFANFNPFAGDPDAPDDSYDGICVPEVPPGLKFWGDSGDTGATPDADAVTLCSQGDQQCKVVYRRGGWSRIFDIKKNWKPIMNEYCTSKDWVSATNLVCKSLGDCGAWYNVEGVATDDGFTGDLFEEDEFFSGRDLELVIPDDLDAWALTHEAYNEDPPGFWNELNGSVPANMGIWVSAGGLIGMGLVGGFSNVNKAMGGAGFGQGFLNWFAGGPKSIFTKSTAAETFATGFAKQAVVDEATKLAGQNLVEEVAKEEFVSFTGLDVSQYSMTPSLQSHAQAVIGEMSPEQILEKSGIKGQEELLKQYQGEAVNSLQEQAGKGAQFGSFLNTVMWLYTAYQVVDLVAKQTEERTYTLSCEPWQAPRGGDACEECNDPYKPCSEYKCRSLGQNCDLINVGSENETCVSLQVNDVSAPVISPLEDFIDSPYDESVVPNYDLSNPGFEISELIPTFTAVNLGIQTDEPAVCKYDVQPASSFDEMTQLFGSSIYLYNHSMQVLLPAELTDEDVLARSEGEYTLYVRCSDANGNENLNDYYIRFNVDASPDLTPPTIMYTSIANGVYMAEGVNETEFSVYVNEPVECRWNINDTGYEQMENDMKCSTSSFDSSSIYYGTYECVTTLTDVAGDEEVNYYFRCMDQPGATEEDRNVNEESFVFTVYNTDGLSIDSSSPEGILYTEDVTLELETSLGAQGGNADCAFETFEIDYNNMILFAETGTSVHSQTLTGLDTGSYTYYVTCQDIAGNQNSTMIEFDVDVDDQAPMLLEVYVDTTGYQILYLRFDEASTCEYSTDDSDFVYGEGTPATGTETDEHELTLGYYNYFVKCVDIYDNQGEYMVYL
ncbi:MAG: hypothetical protein ABIF40_05310 [archaeon]